MVRSRRVRVPGLSGGGGRLQALWVMARPGLEPGTPRFSGSHDRARLVAKDLQAGMGGSPEWASMPSLVAGWARILGLRRGSEVPISLTQRRSMTSWVRSRRSRLERAVGSARFAGLRPVLGERQNTEHH